MEDDKNIINNIKQINDDIKDVLEQENIDNEKLFKLRYAQMIQGLYLNNTMFNNF